MSDALMAVSTALAAATLLGASSVAQRRGMVAHDAGPRSGWLTSLLSSRWWWAGTAASVGGLVLQFRALGLGSLILVQTTMVSSIVATTLAEWLLLARRPGTGGWAGMTLTATGLAGVLWALSPTATGSSVPSAWTMVGIGAVGLVAVAAATLRARMSAGGGLALAAATGLGYGITAVALKTVGTQLAVGWSAPLVHPALWVAAGLGPASVLLSQYALKRTRRVAATVSLIVVLDPLVGLVAGVTWFGEHLTTTPAALVLATAAAGAIVVGIAVGHRRPAPADGATAEREVGPGGGVPTVAVAYPRSGPLTAVRRAEPVAPSSRPPGPVSAGGRGGAGCRHPWSARRP